jgi:radical SAM superfamily enzyme YgiQ (UPF0313 family)
MGGREGPATLTDRPVLLVNPLPGQSFYGVTVEHLGLAYLAAVLRNHGFEVVIRDASVEGLSPDELTDLATDRNWLVVGITTLEEQAEVAERLGRAVVEAGRAHVVLGGHYATFSWRDILARRSAHSVVLGEGELTLLELARKLRAGEIWRDTVGLAYADEAGAPVPGRPRPLIADLDTLPRPARDHLAQVLARGGVPSVSGARGCYGRCSFCSIRSFYGAAEGKPWRGRSPESVVSEVEALVKAHGTRVINFVDDNFLGPGRAGRERARSIADLILSRGLDIRFFISCRPNDVDEVLFARLYQAGLRVVALGLEAGNVEDLALYRKDVTVDVNVRAVTILDRLGVVVRAGFINFNPFTTLTRLRQNIEFLRRIPFAPTSAVAARRLFVRRGCPIESVVRDAGLLITHENRMTYAFADHSAAIACDLAERFERKCAPVRHISRLISRMNDDPEQAGTYASYRVVLDRLRSLQLDALEAVVEYAERTKTLPDDRRREDDEAFLASLVRDFEASLEAVSRLVSPGGKCAAGEWT